MLSEEEYFDDSGDPELAFVRLEAKLRSVYREQAARIENNNYAETALMIEYMNHALAAADALGLDAFEGWTVPSHDAKDADIWSSFRSFTTAADHYGVKIRIAHANGRRAFSFALNPIDKQKIRHYVEQIKKILETSSLTPAKKEALFDKINEFLSAVDKDRTWLQAFSELVTGSAAIMGDAAEEAEPAWKWLRQIAAIFGAKIEETKSLPRPNGRERIEGPRKRLPPPEHRPKRSELDDDIPF